MKKILALILLGLFLLPGIALADGGVFPPDDFYILETGQKGVILFENTNETLVLSTSFEGDAKDFSWIIPTPSQPEVTKVSKEIFTNLAELTQTEEQYSIKSPGFGATSVEGLETVEILEQKQIGYYDVTVLKSTDKNALYDWLSENGYQYPEEGKYILDDYIRLEWVFTAVKITEDALSDAGLTEKLNFGDISPLRFIFETENIVYPLKISGIARFSEEPIEPIAESGSNNESSSVSKKIAPTNISRSMPIVIYVFADQKKELINFTTEYANWVEPQEINKLATDEEGNPWVNVDKKYYLTKMYTNMQLDKMDEDLFPQNAEDDDKVGVLSWWENTFVWMMETIIFWAFILLLMFFVPIYWQFRRTSRTCHILSWISQLVSFLFIGFLPLLYSLMIVFSLPYTGGLDFSMLVVGLPYIIMPLLMVVLLIAQGIWQKKNM